MNQPKQRRRGGVHPAQLRRYNCADGRRLDLLQKRLKVANGSEALAEAIAMALLITDGGRRRFFIEDPEGKLIRVDI